MPIRNSIFQFLQLRELKKRFSFLGGDAFEYLTKWKLGRVPRPSMQRFVRGVWCFCPKKLEAKRGFYFSMTGLLISLQLVWNISGKKPFSLKDATNRPCLRKNEGQTFDVVYAGCSFDPDTEQLKLLLLGRNFLGEGF